MEKCMVVGMEIFKIFELETESCLSSNTEKGLKISDVWSSTVILRLVNSIQMHGKSLQVHAAATFEHEAGSVI